MGYLAYDSSTRIMFDDRVLAHLEVVITAKLRRHEAFTVTWRDPVESGQGRNTIWLDPSIPLRFHFDGADFERIDRIWVEQLSIAATGTRGLVVTDENGAPVSGFLIEQ